MLSALNDKITIIGSPISPYVRKILITLEMKSIEFDCVPQVPFFPTEEFKTLSPLGRIPVLKQGTFVLPDSSAIIQYLEDLVPTPSVFPRGSQNKAQALWFEEYGDDYLGRTAVYNLFFQKVVRPLVLKQPADNTLIEQALSVQLPKAMTYLEGKVPQEGYFFDELSIADITLSSMLLNAIFAGWQIDAVQWPKMASYLERVYAHPVVAKYNALANKLRKLSHTEHQEAVNECIATP